MKNTKNDVEPTEVTEEKTEDQVSGSESETKENPVKIEKEKHTSKFNLRALVSTKKRKRLTIAASIIILLALIIAIPITRYFVLSPFIKKDVSLKIVDSKTNEPVSNANVQIGDKSTQTDKDGIAKLSAVPVGQYTVSVKKQYYQDTKQNYTVPVFSSPKSVDFDIKAIGRQVHVSITNKITGDPLSDVSIESSGTKATTGSDGTTVIILPSTIDSAKATVSKDGYNSVDVTLKVDDTTDNTYSITPSGSLYYLSKATGKINVMKSNLDGSNAAVVVAGTGQESDSETSLLSARDWSYSALKATRTDNKERLYLIDAKKGDFTVMDEGDATFNLVGWSGHNFIYTVYRNGNVWDNKQQALKSYNADTRTVTTLDETVGAGTGWANYSYEYFSNIYILKDEIVYVKNWNMSASDANKKPSLYSVGVNGGSKKLVKSFAANSVEPKLYEPQGVYLRVVGSGPDTFYEYEDGAVKQVTDINYNQFSAFYPTFLISPSGKQTLWYEPRDGKNTVFIGDEDGKNSKTIGNLSDYTPYGWYGSNDEYILLTKNGSELYISSASKVIGDKEYQPLKVTDYHKTRTYAGYGYGYGGQ